MGVYEWLVLLMGLKTAPTAYQRMLAACLDTGFGDKKSFTKRFGKKPYIDDLLHGTPDLKKVPTRTGPRCAPSACYPC